MLDALRLSLLTSVGSTVLVVLLGLPVAYQLASRDFPGKRLIELLVDLPMVLPPTVAGVALLTAFGRAGLAGGALQAIGVTLPFTTLGRGGRAGLRRRRRSSSGPPERGWARWTGDTSMPPRRSGRPGPHLSARRASARAPSLLAGAAMSWARALGEFGATITFAGNMPGITQTMPLAVYIALQSDLDAAIALSVLLLAVSVAIWPPSGTSRSDSPCPSPMLVADLAERRGTFELAVELTAAAGETTVLVGESGAGKTSILRLLAGLDYPDRGTDPARWRGVRRHRRQGSAGRPGIATSDTSRRTTHSFPT